MTLQKIKEKFLFICKHNSARSQMVEGLLKTINGDYYEVYSAGTNPETINPYTVKVMAERGIDISMNRSKSLNEFKGVMWLQFVVEEMKLAHISRGKNISTNHLMTLKLLMEMRKKK